VPVIRVGLRVDWWGAVSRLAGLPLGDLDRLRVLRDGLVAECEAHPSDGRFCCSELGSAFFFEREHDAVWFAMAHGP
jgi:hypothetical protein